MKFKNIANILGIFSVISIIGISFFTWRFCDDFYLEKNLQLKGVFEYMYQMFMNWDGRFLSVAAFIQLAAIKYLNHNIVVFIWSLFFIINCFLIFKIIADETGINTKLKINEIFVPISVVIICIFYGFSTHISETVFFETGGAYMVHVFIGLIWILIYRKIIKEFNKAYKIVLFSLFTIIVGMHTQNLVICLLFFLVIEGILFIYNNDRKKVRYIFLFFVCLLSGLAITSFSPGSLIRASSSPNSFDPNFLHYFKYLYLITKIFIRASIYLIPLSVISAMVVFINFDVKIDKKQNYPDNKLVKFLVDIKWLLISSSSILPFLFIPNTVTYRSALFFMLFLYIFIVIGVIEFLNKVKTVNFLKFKLPLNIILLVLFVCHLGYMSYCYKYGFEYQKFMSDTDKFLLTKMNKTGPIVVKKINVPDKPFVFKSSIELFLSSDPAYWVNKEWEYYYDIKILKAE